VAELHDGRILVVEYKGEAYKTNDDSKEKRQIGQLWEEKSGGKGTRYLLSQRLYAAIGAKGVYTRKKGLDYETKKALLEKHLREYESGAPLAELRQVLPAESERSIQRLLSEMRDEGRVVLHGKRRWARWVFVKAKTQND
jgi:ATP-dependent DNA helicase RecG